jgi:hypothetical protein
MGRAASLLLVLGWRRHARRLLGHPEDINKTLGGGSKNNARAADLAAAQ